MESPFSLRDFLRVFTLSIILFTGFAVIFQFVPNVEELLSGFHPAISFMLEYLVQFVILFFPLWLFVVDKYGAGLSDFGFHKISFWKLLKTVLACYLFYLLFTYLLLSILTALNISSLPGYEQQESYLPLFGYDAFGLTVAFIVVAVLAPFLEELFFRGFIFRTFQKTWPTWLASILTAVLFALVHFQLQTFFPLFLLGLILNAAYERTGSVWTSVAFHSMNNTIAFGLDVYLYFHPEFLDSLMSR